MSEQKIIDLALAHKNATERIAELEALLVEALEVVFISSHSYAPDIAARLLSKPEVKALLEKGEK